LVELFLVKQAASPSSLNWASTSTEVVERDRDEEVHKTTERAESRVLKIKN
jgi:hypothetical protein